MAKTNFVLFITDQQRADWLGCYGHPLLRTPNIDTIAAQGTLFQRFFVASPVCMPNRASLMTGRYPSVHGLRHNGHYLPRDAVTFVDVLAQAGYHTAGIGKSHIQPFTGAEAFERVSRNDLGFYDEACFSDGQHYDLEDPRRYAQGELTDFPVPYYGFQHINMLTGHGFKSGGHYLQWLRERADNYQELLDPKHQLPHDYKCSQAKRLRIPEALYPTSYVKDMALDYLSGREGQDDPFFAFVSFNDPHHPFNPPGKYWDMYKPEDFAVPPGYNTLTNPIPPLQRVHQDYLDGKQPLTLESVFMTDGREIQEAMALTAGMISMIDDAIGEIVQKLKDIGEYDNTVIIFTSDHGDYLGDFNLMLKGALPYQGITRVPFIWSDPDDRKPRQSSSLASTLDIAPSLIKRAGLKPYWGIQGQDITQQVMGEASSRQNLMIEFHDSLPRFGFEQPAVARSLITDRHRLTVYLNQSFGELYDLHADPLEQHNRFNDADYQAIQAELMTELMQQMIATVDVSPRAVMRA